MSFGEPTRSERDEGDIPQFRARIQAGDESAARELLARYEAEVRLVVRRQLPRLLRSRFDSLDFLQSVWGSFFRRVRSGPAEFEDSRHLVAFLARAAKNKVIDEYRRAAPGSRPARRRPSAWRGGSRPPGATPPRPTATATARISGAGIPIPTTSCPTTSRTTPAPGWRCSAPTWRSAGRRGSRSVPNG